MSSIQVAKVSMGYMTPLTRPSCRNCVHGKEEHQYRRPPFDTVTWQCKKGGFRTLAMACCQQHVRDQFVPGR